MLDDPGSNTDSVGYRAAPTVIRALIFLATLGVSLGVATAAEATAAIPPATSYGHGPFAFKVTFLAKPGHHFERHPTGPTGRPLASIVADSRYQATFSSEYGTGTEIVAVVELARRPTDTCQVVRLLFHGPTPKCPTTRVRNRKIPPGSHVFTVLHTVVRCPVKSCEGYAGAIAILHGKMLYYVSIENAGRTTVERVQGSLSP